MLYVVIGCVVCCCMSSLAVLAMWKMGVMDSWAWLPSWFPKSGGATAAASGQLGDVVTTPVVPAPDPAAAAADPAASTTVAPDTVAPVAAAATDPAAPVSSAKKAVKLLSPPKTSSASNARRAAKPAKQAKKPAAGPAPARLTKPLRR